MFQALPSCGITAEQVWRHVQCGDFCFQHREVELQHQELVADDRTGRYFEYDPFLGDSDAGHVVLTLHFGGQNMIGRAELSV
jgi:hypothetical protein